MSNSRFEISNVNVLTSWRFELPKNQDCIICRCNLHEDSIDFQNKGVSSYVVFGECGHSFHKECLDGWIKNNMRCPICGDKWSFQNSPKKS